MNQLLVHCVRARWIAAGASRDRLQAFALPVRQEAQRVQRERRSLSFVAQRAANTIEVRMPLLNGFRFESRAHATLDHEMIRVPSCVDMNWEQ